MTAAVHEKITAELPRYLSVSRAARYAGVSERTLWYMLSDGRLRRCTLPGLRRALIDRHELDALLRQDPANGGEEG